jgi:hypothetical protein
VSSLQRNPFLRSQLSDLRWFVQLLSDYLGSEPLYMTGAKERRYARDPKQETRANENSTLYDSVVA